MKRTEEKTKVVFRVFSDGQIIALFPGEVWNASGDIASYMHIGQHGAASRGVVDVTRLATPTQSNALKNELENIGYNLQIGKRVKW